MIKLRRDIEDEKTTAAIWSKEAEKAFRKRIRLPPKLLGTVKAIIFFGFFTFIYTALVCGFKPYAMYNKLIPSNLADRYLYLIYWFTTFLHLCMLILTFSRFSKTTVSI